MTTINASDALFFRVDMPGHIKHRSGDAFDHIYLSYGDMTIPSTEFTADFPLTAVSCISEASNRCPIDSFERIRPFWLVNPVRGLPE